MNAVRSLVTTHGRISVQHLVLIYPLKINSDDLVKGVSTITLTVDRGNISTIMQMHWRYIALNVSEPSMNYVGVCHTCSCSDTIIRNRNISCCYNERVFLESMTSDLII